MTHASPPSTARRAGQLSTTGRFEGTEPIDEAAPIDAGMLAIPARHQ
jgi:hypothetical protein